MKIKPSSNVYEIPSEDNHRAACVALVDLGTQREEYQGSATLKRKLLVVWELLSETRTDGNAFLLPKIYTFSLNEKAALRKAYEAVNGKIENDVEVDLCDMLQLPVMLDIRHEQKQDRIYARIEGVAPALKLERGIKQKTQYGPYVYSMVEGCERLDPLPNWLPLIFGRKPQAVIAESPEYQNLRGKNVSVANEEAF